MSQNSTAGTTDSINFDSLLSSGLDELLSYLFLTRDDFIFRDDYTEKDIFRLDIVDSLMKNPLNLVDFADSCALIFENFEDCPDCLPAFFEELRGKESGQNPKQGLRAKDSPFRFRKLREPLRSVVQNMADELDGCQTMIESITGGPQTKRHRFITTKYREVILEDENYKRQTPEEMDSIQHLEEEYTLEFAKIAENLSDIPFQKISGLFQMIDSAYSVLGKDEKLRKRSRPGKPLYKIKTAYGPVVIGSFGDDIYRGDYFMILDPGGNDSYYLIYDIENPHPVLIADYSGSDFYKAESDFSLASGAFSNSLLIDYEGDDIYRGGNFSLGSGYFGTGLLWDKKGNDSYFGDTFTQGAGTFGLGLLIDSEGSDTYTGNLFCQGFGFVRGFGGIVDYLGNDTYTVQGKYPESFHTGSHFQSLSQGFAVGVRPYLSGGFGFLYDFAGNDAYIADFFCQGTSYWWSLGLLYDNAGDDRYLSYQYAQGAGIHMSLGYLRDNEGNDIYRSHGVCQGCGHDYSCGWLIDISGDDIYSAHDLAQGAGQANGFGIFSDLAGDDGYYVFRKDNAQGYGNPRRDYGSIGLFLDLDGRDRYDGNGANNCFWRTPSKWGGGLDRGIKSPDSTEAK